MATSTSCRLDYFLAFFCDFEIILLAVERLSKLISRASPLPQLHLFKIDFHYK